MAILFSGCGKVENITKEEYSLVKSEMISDFLNDAYCGHSIHIRIPYGVRKVFNLNIPLSKGYGRGIPRIALNHEHVHKEANRNVKRACRQFKISFRSFDICHAKYGRLGLTYTRELEEFDSLLAVLEPEIKEEFIKNGIPFDYEDVYGDPYYTPYNHERTVLYELDSTVLERAAWLAHDLGLSEGIIVEIDKDGNYLVDGENISLKGKIEPLVERDPYLNVHLIPAPDLSCGKFSEIVDSIRSFGAQRISFSNKLAIQIWLKIPSVTCVGGPEEEIANFPGPVILLEKGDSVRIRNESMSLNLQQLMERLSTVLKERERKRVILLADEKASCGFLIETAKALRKTDIEVILYFSGRHPYYPYMIH